MHNLFWHNLTSSLQIFPCYFPKEWESFFYLFILDYFSLANICYFSELISSVCVCSNRVEAWTRDVQFLLRQEGRPVTQLVGNMSTVRIMRKDWENTDKATQWLQQRAESSQQPFALYLGLNLPHPYKTESLGPTAGGSTFRTSPYWLEKAGCYLIMASIQVFTWILTKVLVLHRCLLNTSLFLNGSQ